MLTQHRLKQVIYYDPDTGLMWWVKNHQRPELVGKIAGAHDAAGYITIGIDMKRYRAHRLAFLYMTGSMPDLVDHKNGIKDDNRWNNLRESDKVRNAQNIHRSHRDSKTGLLGVEVCRNKFMARISIRGVRIGLGSFDTAEEAHQAYMAAKRAFHEGVKT